jgi:hypothetical protein
MLVFSPESSQRERFLFSLSIFAWSAPWAVRSNAFHPILPLIFRQFFPL